MSEIDLEEQPKYLTDLIPDWEIDPQFVREAYKWGQNRKVNFGKPVEVGRFESDSQSKIMVEFFPDSNTRITLKVGKFKEEKEEKINVKTGYVELMLAIPSVDWIDTGEEQHVQILLQRMPEEIEMTYLDTAVKTAEMIARSWGYGRNETQKAKDRPLVNKMSITFDAGIREENDSVLELMKRLEYDLEEEEDSGPEIKFSQPLPPRQFLRKDISLEDNYD